MLYLDILIIHLTEDIRFLYLSTFYAFYTLLLFIDYPYISTIFLVVLIVLLHLLSPKIVSALIFLSITLCSINLLSSKSGDMSPLFYQTIDTN